MKKIVCMMLCLSLMLGGFALAEGTYTPEAHRGMGQMYVADERFRAYYDGPCGDGAAQFLCDAIGLWA